MLFLGADLEGYIPILILVIMALLFVVANMGVTHLFGPRKLGARKDITYESGMNPIGTARRRFNVRFSSSVSRLSGRCMSPPSACSKQVTASR